MPTRPRTSLLAPALPWEELLHPGLGWTRVQDETRAAEGAYPFTIRTQRYRATVVVRAMVRPVGESDVGLLRT